MRRAGIANSTLGSCRRTGCDAYPKRLLAERGSGDTINAGPLLCGFSVRAASPEARWSPARLQVPGHLCSPRSFTLNHVNPVLLKGILSCLRNRSWSVAFWSPLVVPSFLLLFVVQSQLNHHISDNFGWQYVTSLNVASLQIRTACDDPCAESCLPILCLFSTFNARPASQEMLLEGREFRLAPR